MRESTLTEKACVVEPLSAMERERTMRSLVDMQKKVEERQQRDRERQLLKARDIRARLSYLKRTFTVILIHLGPGASVDHPEQKG